MTPTNQSVSGDAQNFGRPLQPLVHGTGPCWPGEIPDQRGCGTVEFKHGPIRPCKSLRDRTKCLLGTPLARPWGIVPSGHAYGAFGRASHRRLCAARPERPLAERNPRPTRLRHDRIQARPNPPVQKSTRSHQRASGHPFRPSMGRRSQSGKHTGHWAEHPIVDWARHGPYGSWPSEIPDQRGSGTAGVDHGIIRPCKSLRNRTQCLLGTPLARPWGGVHCRARIRGLGTSLPSSRARGTARTAPGRVKSPTRSSSDHASTGAGGQKSTVAWTPCVPSEEGITSLREKFLKISKTHKYKVQPCFFSLSR